MLCLTLSALLIRDRKTNRTQKTLSVFIICLLLASCSFPDEKLKPILIDKTLTLAKNKKTIEGTGRVLFDQALFSLNSKELYSLKAEFFQEDSWLTLHSHLQSFQKEDGIKIFFIRERETLIIEAATPNHKKQSLYKEEGFFTNNQQMYVYVEVHNGTKNFIHIRIWNRHLNPTGYLKTTYFFISDQGLLADSSEQTFYSKGRGLLWGMELYKARLVEVLRESTGKL